MQYDDEKLKDAARDDIAELVINRFKRGVDYKNSHIVHQGLSFQELIERASAQYRREYTPEDAKAMEEIFGFCPSRYYGLVQIKTNATRAWKRDLVVSNIDNMFTCFPSPNPDLDEASRARIRRNTQRELEQRMLDGGVTNPQMLVDARTGEPDFLVKDFLEEQVKRLAAVERARIVAQAATSAKAAHTRLRDILVEGDFRTTYSQFTHQQVLYGIGFIKFPDMQRKAVMEHVGKRVKRKFKVVPNFRNVDVFNIFPTGDGSSLHDCTAVVELAYITKIDLINLHNTNGYYKDEILAVLDEFQSSDRNWLGIEEGAAANPFKEVDYWDLDGTIPMLIHEGFLSGRELSEMGIKGVKDTEYVNAEVVVVGGRTIKCKLLKAPDGTERTYYGVPFIRHGAGIWDVLGMGAMLWDTEQRINRIMHVYENNLDWAARPPLLVNPEAFADTSRVLTPQPGETYEVNQDILLSTGGRLPDPMRAIQGSSAQYHLIYTQVQALLRAADEECGIPAFAYGAQDFGRASLGEYSQRMSNALRTIKEAALEEDAYFIEPAFENMFARLMQEEPELAEGQDVNMQVRGLTGLLSEDQSKTNAKETLGMLVNLNNQPGLIEPEVLRYGVRSFLEASGMPVEALGISDPTVERAMTLAASHQAMQPHSAIGGVGGMQGTFNAPQVPQVDGRSGGIPQGAVAQANGMTNYGMENQ